MAVKQTVFEVDNGATVIYQKQPKGTRTSVVLGFSGGAKLDGKYKGLSHLVEHLFLVGESTKQTKKLIEDCGIKQLFTNAFTSQHCICHVFDALDDDLEQAIETCMKTITKKRISQKEIDKEIEVVKHEIDMIKDRMEKNPPNAFHLLLNSLRDKEYRITTYNSLDVLGSAKTLKMMTPEIINEYARRYFNTDNLIISISSSKSAEEVLDILRDKVFPKLPRAKSKKYIVELPEAEKYTTENTLMVSPNEPSHNVRIDTLLRTRTEYPIDMEQELAFGFMDELCLNGSGAGGVLFDKFRTENQLVYSAHQQDLNMGSALFKHFRVVTNAAKMRKAIKVLCDTIYDLGVNGYSKKMFDQEKQKAINLLDTSQDQNSGFALQNLSDYIWGFPFVDQARVERLIKNMTYEDFNNYVKYVYKNANI